MKGDFTRNTFDPEKHYSGVLMQQGRVQVDADWNEQQAITRYRMETEALDVIGPCGAPEDHAGFGISLEDGKLLIGKGRIYVDGILCENDTDELPYEEQPDLPGAPDWGAVLAEAGASVALVYLDVWQRHVTALDDPLIREVALGGPDTATRVKTLWQVKVMPLDSADRGCEQWPQDLLPISTGTLNARTQEIADEADPCLLPPTSGYKRLENQLYRVEIHDGGKLGEATFKWSRDNGTVVTAIEEIIGSDVTVHDLGRDEVLGFAPGQWVEISDDVRELHGEPGELLQIVDVDPAERKITLSAAPSANMAHHPKLRRWDSPGPITVEIPADNNGWIELEGGIEVLFAEEGIYKPGDYWLIPARTATGEIEWPPYEPGADPVAQPPLGILHHYCHLALVNLQGEVEVRTLIGIEQRSIMEDLAESVSTDGETLTVNLVQGETMPDGEFFSASVVADMLAAKGFDSEIVDYTIKFPEEAVEVLKEVPIVTPDLAESWQILGLTDTLSAWFFYLVHGVTMPDDSLFTAYVVDPILQEYDYNYGIDGDYTVFVMDPTEDQVKELSEIPIIIYSEELEAQVTDCRHIFQPLTRITSGEGHEPYLALRYVGGDGQHGRPGDTLPCTLAVGVEDELGRPAPGIAVRFAVSEGCGTLRDVKDAANSGTSIDVVTEGDGIAQVWWTLDPKMEAGGCCRVTAELGSSLEIHFKATVRVWPRVTEINWINDQPRDLGDFNAGLRVSFSQDMDPLTLSLDTFIVTLELPTIEPPALQVEELAAQMAAIQEGMAYPGHRIFIVPGVVSRFTDGLFTWIFKPTPPLPVEVLRNWVKTTDGFFPALAVPVIRCRVLLKGNAILSEEGEPLDGEAFGIPAEDDNGNRFTDLDLPSGDGHKGGDFESWFYLVE